MEQGGAPGQGDLSHSCTGRCQGSPPAAKVSASVPSFSGTSFPSIAAAASAGVVAANIWTEYRSGAGKAYNAYATFAADEEEVPAAVAEEETQGFGLSRSDLFRRSFDAPTPPAGECRCDSSCIEYGDCCIDYFSLC